jgi:hypothetical protein
MGNDAEVGVSDEKVDLPVLVHGTDADVPEPAEVAQGDRGRSTHPEIGCLGSARARKVGRLTSNPFSSLIRARTVLGGGCASQTPLVRVLNRPRRMVTVRRVARGGPDGAELRRVLEDEL